MKLRLMPDSVRLRLNRNEVAALARERKITATVLFPGAKMCYSLRASPDCVAGARFENCELIITVPENQAYDWAHSHEQIGLYYEQECAKGQSLRIIVEKDFQCIDAPPEEIDDAAYPNPAAKTGCKADSDQ